MKIKKSQLEQLIKEAVRKQGGNEKTQQRIIESVKMKLNEDGQEVDTQKIISVINNQVENIRENANRIISTELPISYNTINTLKENLSYISIYCQNILESVKYIREIHPAFNGEISYKNSTH